MCRIALLDVPLLHLALLALSGLADLAFALACIARKRRALGADRPFGLDALVGAAAPFVPFYVLKAVLLVGVGGSFFYGASVAYVTVFLVAPALGAIALLRRWTGWRRSREAATTRTTPAVRALACASLLLPFVGAYASFVEPLRLTEERVAIAVSAERLAAPLRIAVLADIQSERVEPQLAAAVASALAFEPHLILLPGDLIQAPPGAYERAAPAFRELLRPLTAPLGVYFVLGNTDDPERVRAVLEGTNVRLLRNETVELEHAGRPLRLGGADFYPSAPHVVAFVRELERLPGADLRILLAHYPDVALALGRGTRVDLTIAGHTHGGQVRIPFFGPPITLSRVPRRVAGGGLSDMDGRRLYVSRGLGSERGLAPRIRFLAPPEVSLLTLVPRDGSE